MDKKDAIPVSRMEQAARYGPNKTKEKMVLEEGPRFLYIHPSLTST